MISPRALLPSSANQSMKLAAYATSARDSVMGLPISSVMMWARSSWYSRKSWYQRRRMAPRSFAVRRAQSRCASAAASIACRVSSRARSATLAMTSSVAGSMTSNVVPESASIHSPATKPDAFSSVGSLRFTIAPFCVVSYECAVPCSRLGNDECVDLPGSLVGIGRFGD